MNMMNIWIYWYIQKQTMVVYQEMCSYHDANTLNVKLLIKYLRYKFDHVFLMSSIASKETASIFKDTIFLHFKTILSNSDYEWEYIVFNSFQPSDVIWQHKSGSTLAQVMGSYLTAPSNYLNQYWLIIRKVQWHSFEGNFTPDTLIINH